jgi:RNA-binding protein
MKSENKHRKQLRAIGHRLNPVVIVSNGVTEGVIAEIDRALKDHELIKIRINAADREEKQEQVAAICKKLDAELIQMAGHIALIFRAALKPKAELSNLLRHQELLKE